MKNGLFKEDMNKQFNKQIIRTITRIIIPGVLFFALPACKNDPKDIKLLTSKNNTHEDKAEDITGIYSKKGVVKARLFAHEYIKNESAKPPYTDLNTRIKVEFYNDSGKLDNTLTADSCRVYDATGNALIWGHVQIVTTKGEQLNTEELVWNSSIERIFTEKPVKITTGSEVLYGNGLEAKQDFSWYQINNPKGSVSVQKGEMPTD